MTTGLCAVAPGRRRHHFGICGQPRTDDDLNSYVVAEYAGKSV
jgi:hypothetical protein